jgi:hypothetical protein
MEAAFKQNHECLKTHALITNDNFKLKWRKNLRKGKTFFARKTKFPQFI